MLTCAHGVELFLDDARQSKVSDLDGALITVDEDVPGGQVTVDVLLGLDVPHSVGDLRRHNKNIILFLVLHFNFLFVPCGRLSWLPVSFLLHVKYTLSYRIV